MTLHYKSALILALVPLAHAVHAADLDHIGIVVHDLPAAEKLFHDTLGFTIGVGGWLPDGVRDTSIDFKSGQFLELIAISDRAKASVRQSDLVQFAESHEGAFFAALKTSSASKTAAILRSRGVKFDGPTGNAWTLDGIEEQFPEGWLRIRLHDLPVWFIENHDRVWKRLEEKYPQLKEDRSAHANGAMAIRAVSIGVGDLKASTQAWKRAGLDRIRNVVLTQDSLTTVTLAVTDLAKTIAALHRDLPVYTGPQGRCVAVEAKNTKLEFCQ